MSKTKQAACGGGGGGLRLVMREKGKEAIGVWGRKRQEILENVLNHSKWERERAAHRDGAFSAFKLNTSAY